MVMYPYCYCSWNHRRLKIAEDVAIVIDFNFIKIELDVMFWNVITLLWETIHTINCVISALLIHFFFEWDKQMFVF